MFLYCLLNTEYLEDISRKPWYLHFLYLCKKNNDILISHEYMQMHQKEIFGNSLYPKFFSDWEMEPFTYEEVKDVEQYYIPDRIFTQSEINNGSRTEMLLEFFLQRNYEFENCLNEIIDAIKKKHPGEKIEGMFNAFEGYKSQFEVCARNNIPFIPISFSAIRQYHGYRQSMYRVSINSPLNCTDYAQKRYEKFLAEKDSSLPVFSNREIIAMLGKERTLQFIQVMNHEPQYEIGICGEGCPFLPNFFDKAKYVDDDIFYECYRLYGKDQIKVRSHNLLLQRLQVDRSTSRGDAASYILSCRRVASVRSEISMKPLLWKRTSVMKKNTLLFSYMCENDYTSTDLVNLQALNHYVFAVLVPIGLLFSRDYLRWRLNDNPTETEIYKCHLQYYVKRLNLHKELLEGEDEPIRFRRLLEDRGCDTELISILLEDNQDYEVNYDVLASRIVVDGKPHWRINKVEGGELHTHCEINVNKAACVEFCPTDDLAGSTKLNRVVVNGKEIDKKYIAGWSKDYMYMPKGHGYYVVALKDVDIEQQLVIDFYWQYETVQSFLDQQG